MIQYDENNDLKKLTKSELSDRLVSVIREYNRLRTAVIYETMNHENACQESAIEFLARLGLKPPPKKFKISYVITATGDQDDYDESAVEDRILYNALCEFDWKDLKVTEIKENE